MVEHDLLDRPEQFYNVDESGTFNTLSSENSYLLPHTGSASPCPSKTEGNSTRPRSTENGHISEFHLLLQVQVLNHPSLLTHQCLVHLNILFLILLQLHQDQCHLVKNQICLIVLSLHAFMCCFYTVCTNVHSSPSPDFQKSYTVCTSSSS